MTLLSVAMTIAAVVAVVVLTAVVAVVVLTLAVGTVTVDAVRAMRDLVVPSAGGTLVGEKAGAPVAARTFLVVVPVIAREVGRRAGGKR